MGVDNLTPRELYPLARELQQVAGSERMNMFLLGSGGLTMRSALCDALQTYHVGYRKFLLVQNPPGTSNGYRSVIGIKSSIEKRSQVGSPAGKQVPRSKIALLVDDNVHSGVAIIGGVLYCLENRGELGSFDRLYTLVHTDEKGYATNFAMQRETKALTDFERLLKETSPHKYRGLERKDLLKYLAREISPLVLPVDTSHNGLDDILFPNSRDKDDGEAFLRRLTEC